MVHILLSCAFISLSINVTIKYYIIIYTIRRSSIVYVLLCYFNAYFSPQIKFHIIFILTFTNKYNIYTYYTYVTVTHECNTTCTFYLINIPE